jgi:hypothetical protein
MSQANSNTYPIRSRRAVLAGIAAGGAVAVVAGIPASARRRRPSKASRCPSLRLSGSGHEQRCQIPL